MGRATNGRRLSDSRRRRERTAAPGARIGNTLSEGRTVERFCFIAMAVLALVLTPTPSRAEAPAWPIKPIRLIVPHAPGGVTDVVTRMVAQPLSEALGQPVVIDNKPGAAGLVGTEIAAKASPDGYTLVMFVDTNTIFPATVKELHAEVFGPPAEVNGADAERLRRFNDIAIAHGGYIGSRMSYRFLEKYAYLLK